MFKEPTLESNHKRKVEMHYLPSRTYTPAHLISYLSVNMDHPVILEKSLEG